jgi:hypothetical protein
MFSYTAGKAANHSNSWNENTAVSELKDKSTEKKIMPEWAFLVLKSALMVI